MCDRSVTQGLWGNCYSTRSARHFTCRQVGALAFGGEECSECLSISAHARSMFCACQSACTVHATTPVTGPLQVLAGQPACMCVLVIARGSNS